MLRPGGVLAISLADRCSLPRAVVRWTELHILERVGFVLDFMLEVGTGQSVAMHSLARLRRPMRMSIFNAMHCVLGFSGADQNRPPDHGNRFCPLYCPGQIR